jgi:drug/metabolite transporter (DMT)-like permease
MDSGDPAVRRAGVLAVLLATFGWSFSGTFTRLLTTDAWTATSIRSLFGCLFLALVALVFERRRGWRPLIASGWMGLWVIACQVIAQACTVGALYNTTVANVTVIYATSPFLAAGIAWLMMGERPRPRTILAGLVSLAGVLVIVAGSLDGGHLLGDLLAIGMTASFACVIVIPRARPELPVMQTTLISGFATALVFLPFASPLQTTAWNWAVLAGFGLTNFTIGGYLFVYGARRIRSAEAALIATLEIALAPLWVWLLFAERPAPATLIGGGIVFTVVVWHTARDLREAASTA